MIHLKTTPPLTLMILLLLIGCALQGETPFDNADEYGSKMVANGHMNASGTPPKAPAVAIEYEEGKGFVGMDPEGKILFTVFPFDNGPDYPSEGLFRIIEDDKIGFANEQGEIVIPPRFSAALPFHGGLSAYCDGCIEVREGEHAFWQKGKWGFIDTRGTIVIPARFDRVNNDFGSGNAVVEKEGRTIIIDKQGNPIKKREMDQDALSENPPGTGQAEFRPAD